MRLRRPVSPASRWFDPFEIGERFAFVEATDGHFASTVLVDHLRPLIPCIAERLQKVSFLQPASVLAGQLNAFRPSVLAAYPSVAVMLAHQAAAGRLQMRLLPAMIGGEPLGPSTRAFIESRFRRPVFES